LLADGRSVTEVPDGADLELTIDYEAQFNLEQELHSVVEKFDATSAMGIVMDAQTSEILAMANLPLSNGRNRLVTDAFEPGSIMKTFVIASALRENLVRPSTRYFCEGGRWKIGDKWIKEATAQEKFEWLNVTEILANSSNIGTAKIAFDIGAQRLFQGLTDFGFGAKTGIDLPGETRGIVNPLPWRPHLLSNISFGQGIAVTPLQMIAAYGAIANGGVLKTPLLVKRVRRAGDEEPQEFTAEEIRRVLTPQDSATMRLMLTAATEEKATGWNARIPGYHVAGKTGTAQKVDMVKGGYMPNSYVSSFAGFVPAHNPRYVILVAIDDPKKAYYGSQVAAPVFSRIAQYMVRRAGLPPVLFTENNMVHGQGPAAERRRADVQNKAIADLKASVETEAASGVFPNLLGLTLREALARVRGQTKQIEVRGHGVVVRTVPASGAAVTKSHRVTLVLENPD
jgi:cell division protein FtsI (penicillin-binding protein 3)